jgi:hypothetical protein
MSHKPISIISTNSFKLKIPREEDESDEDEVFSFPKPTEKVGKVEIKKEDSDEDEKDEDEVFSFSRKKVEKVEIKKDEEDEDEEDDEVFSFSKHTRKVEKEEGKEKEKEKETKKSSIYSNTDIFNSGYKKPYKYNKVDFILDNLNRKIKYSQYSQKSEKKEELTKEELTKEEKTKLEIKDVKDLFSESTIAMDEEIKIENPNEILDNISKKTIVKELTGKQSRNKYISHKDFFEELFKLFNYLNAEERGKLIIKLSFGGLILNPVITDKTPQIINLVKLFKNILVGGSNSNVSKLYVDIVKLIESEKLDDYRKNVQSINQIINIVNLTNKIVGDPKEPPEKRLHVFFPENVSVKNNITSKSIIISKIPTVDDFVTFYKKLKVENKKIKKGHEDEDYDYTDPNDY